MIYSNHRNSNFQKTQSANEVSFESVVHKIRPIIPENFSSLSKLGQFDILIKAIDYALEVEGHWFFINGDMSIKDFLTPSGEAST